MQAAWNANAAPHEAEAPEEEVFEDGYDGAEFPEEEFEGQASSEAAEGEGASSVALDRVGMTREEKLACDSAEAGYPLAHTTSETWGDEHMPKTPDENEIVVASPVDENMGDAPADVCIVDSSPEEASSSSARPSALSRRPHIPDKSWTSSLSPKLTAEQKERFLQACQVKLKTLAPAGAPVTSSTPVWGVSKQYRVRDFW